MPADPRRYRRPLAIVAAIALLTLVPLDPGRLFAPPRGDVLSEVAFGLPSSAPTDVPLVAPLGSEPTGSPIPPTVLPPAPPTPPPPETLTGYRFPLAQVRITQPFGPARGGSWIVDGQPFHDGLDLATFCGDHVRAAHGGLVLAAGRRYDDFMGWLGDLQPYYDRLDAEKLWSTLPLVVVIDDGNGYRSIYAHFSKVMVSAGDVVSAGTFLGYEGASGNASGCHVHLGLFSPDETATMTFDPKLAAKMLLPDREIARVDPLRVLPPVPTPPPASPSPTAP